MGVDAAVEQLGMVTAVYPNAAAGTLLAVIHDGIIVCVLPSAMVGILLAVVQLGTTD